jgi:hypothetical protein
MLDLVEDCRRHGHNGLPIAVVLVDVSPSDVLSIGAAPAVQRDAVMAARLLDARAAGPVVALVGNVHARTDDDFPFPMPPGYRPMAQIVAAETSTVSLLGQHAGGAAWCTIEKDGKPQSGAHPFAGTDLGTAEFVNLDDPPVGYDGIAYVGRITASPPVGA